MVFPSSPSFRESTPNAPRAPSEPPTSERVLREQRERSLEAAFENLITLHAHKINEGNNGVIYQLSVDRLPPDVSDQLRSLGVELEGDQAVKILKFYASGAGEREFNLQQKAFDIVKSQRDPSGLARVPTPILYREWEPTQTLRDKLKDDGVRDDIERVQMLVMDLIPGSDLAAIIYREVLKRHPKTVHLLADIEHMTFDELEHDASVALGFTKASAKERVAGGAGQEAVFAANEKKIYDFLLGSGFRLNPVILTQIERTMDIFHSNGLVFRDGHHRNFVVVGDVNASTEGSTAPAPQAYIIDYGGSAEFEGKYRDDLYQGEGILETKRYINDYSVIQKLMPLAGKGRTDDAEIKVIRSIENFHALLRQKTGWKKLEQDLKQLTTVDESVLEDLYTRFRRQKFDREAVSFTILARLLLDQSPNARGMILDFVQRKQADFPKTDFSKLSAYLGASS